MLSRRPLAGLFLQMAALVVSGSQLTIFKGTMTVDISIDSLNLLTLVGNMNGQEHTMQARLTFMGAVSDVKCITMQIISKDVTKSHKECPSFALISGVSTPLKFNVRDITFNTENKTSVIFVATNFDGNNIGVSYAIVLFKEMNARLSWVGSGPGSSESSIRVDPRELTMFTLGPLEAWNTSTVCNVTVNAPCYLLEDPSLVEPLGVCDLWLRNLENENTSVSQCRELNTTPFTELSGNVTLGLSSQNQLMVEVKFMTTPATMEVTLYNSNDPKVVYAEKRIPCLTEASTITNGQDESYRCSQNISFNITVREVKVLVVALDAEGNVTESIVKLFKVPSPATNVGLIVGIIVGVFVIVAIIVAINMAFMVKRREARTSSGPGRKSETAKMFTETTT